MELIDKKYSNFRGQKFNGEDFSNTDLSYSNFREAECINCNFDGAVIDFCNFKQANVTGSTFNGTVGAYVPWIDTGSPVEHRVQEGVPLEDESTSKQSRSLKSSGMSNIDRTTERTDALIAAEEAANLADTDTKGVEDGSDSIK